MIWVDIAILTVIGISALLSLFRGLVREVLSLLAWVLAFAVARTFNPQAAAFLADKISLPSAQWVLGFALLFVGTLFAVGIVNFLIGKLIAATGLTATDRMLGVIFGVARGIAIVTLLVLGATYTPLPKDSWWHQSLFIPHLEKAALWIRGRIPADLASHFSFTPPQR